MTSASAARLDRARELATAYATHRDVAMVLVTGSAARGIADDFSDLDIVVYWNQLDRAALDACPLRAPAQRTLAGPAHGDGFMERYRLGDLRVDVDSFTTQHLEAVVSAVVQEHDVDPAKQRIAAGLLDAVALHGAREHGRWCQRLRQYPDALAIRMIEVHLWFTPPAAAYALAHARGDLLTYYHRMSALLRNVLGVLAGLNRRYVDTAEPKHTPWVLASLPVQPPRTRERVDAALRAPTPTSIADFHALLVETIDLVDELLPTVSTETARELLAFEVTSWRES